MSTASIDTVADDGPDRTSSIPEGAARIADPDRGAAPGLAPEEFAAQVAGVRSWR